MLAIVVIGCLQVELVALGAAFDGERVALSFLLTGNGGEAEVAKLQLALQTKEALPASNQRRRRIQKDIARLHPL